MTNAADQLNLFFNSFQGVRKQLKLKRSFVVSFSHRTWAWGSPMVLVSHSQFQKGGERGPKVCLRNYAWFLGALKRETIWGWDGWVQIIKGVSFQFHSFFFSENLISPAAKPNGLNETGCGFSGSACYTMIQLFDDIQFLRTLSLSLL